MKVNMRAKSIPVLLMNKRNLPAVIVGHENKGAFDKAENTRKILEDTVAELKRRGREG